MPGALVLKAMEEYERLYQRRLEPIPTMWVTSSQSIRHEDRTLKLFLWYINMFFVISICGVGSCGLLILKHTFFPDLIFRLLLPNVILLFGLIVLGSFVTGIAVIMVTSGDVITYGWNQLSKLDTTVRDQMGMVPPSHPLVQLLVRVMFKGLLLVNVVLTSSGILLKMDPFHFMIKGFSDLFLSGGNLRLLRLAFETLAYPIRALFILICVTESQRIFSVVILALVSGLAMIHNILDNLLSSGGQPDKDIQLQIKYHEELRIFLSIICRPQELCTLGLLVLGVIICGLFILTTIRVFGLLPPILYAMFPLFTVLSMITIHILFPYAHQVNDKSEDILSQWKARGMSHGGHRKYIERRLKAIKPLVFHAGLGNTKFMAIKKETKVEYYGSIVDYSIDVLLTTPADFAANLLTILENY